MKKSDKIPDLNKLLAERWKGKEFMIALIGQHSENLKNLVSIALSDEYPQSWRACWLLNHSMKKNESLVRERAVDFLDILGKREDGHNREIIKILLNMDLNEDQEGLVFDKCLTFWENPSLSPSLRSKAIEYCIHLAQSYPELGREIHALCREELMDTLSPGIRRSLEKKLKSVKK